MASTKAIAEKLVLVIAQRHGIKASARGGKGAGEVNVATAINTQGARFRDACRARVGLAT